MRTPGFPVLLAALAAASLGCQLFIDTKIGKGIGQSCSNDSECHAGTCFESRCSVTCSAASDCPPPTSCQSNGLCELPLDVAFIYVGVPQDEGWTLTHEEGRQVAMEELEYLQSDFVQNTFLPEDAQAAVDQFVTEGYDVIVANSFSLRIPVADKASQYPDTKFLICSSNVTSPNLGSYFGRMEQAYYLAGYAAGLTTTQDRLGFVGSFITPEVVRHINAFTLGARRINPSIVVEVRWVGFWFDLDDPVGGKFAETRLAEEMLETGCDIIAHNMDNGRSVIAVESASNAGTYTYPIYSVGNDNQNACENGPTTCLGTSYWNWGPVYVRLFDEIHRGTWDPAVIVNDNIGVDPAKSIVNFGVNDAVAGTNVSIAVGELLSDLARPGNEHVAFDGPYCSTGQRDPACVAAGETIEDEELQSMCWFVEGVVSKADPADPMSVDVPAQVPPECLTQQ